MGDWASWGAMGGSGEKLLMSAHLTARDAIDNPDVISHEQMVGLRVWNLLLVITALVSTFLLIQYCRTRASRSASNKRSHGNRTIIIAQQLEQGTLLLENVSVESSLTRGWGSMQMKILTRQCDAAGYSDYGVVMKRTEALTPLPNASLVGFEVHGSPGQCSGGNSWQHGISQGAQQLSPV